MKKIYFIITALVCMATFTMQAADWYPANVVKVTPDAGGIPPSEGNGALRSALAEHGSAIYELQRGGVYYVNKTCAFADQPAVVRAAAGEGPRPVIIPFGSGSDLFSGGANLRFEDLYIYGVEYDGPIRRGIYRASAGTSFEFENCVFDGAAASSILRFESINGSVFEAEFYLTINACTFKNAVDYANISNARGIDFRDSKGMHVSITNSTFYSVSSQTIRYGDCAVLDFTFVNNTVFGAASSLGIGTAEKATVKNNIFYNLQLNGSTTPGGGSLLAISPIEYPREMVVTNNLFYREEAFDALASASTTHFLVDNVLDNTGLTLVLSEELVVADTLKYAVNFANPPASLLPFYQYVWQNDKFNTAILPEDQAFERREVPVNIKEGGRITGFVGDDLGAVKAYDFSYLTTSPAATAGEGGTYLGAWKPNNNSSVPSLSKNKMNCSFDAAAKQLNIQLEEAVSVLKVAIYTANGALVASQFVVPYGLSATYSPSGLSEGIYLYVVESPEGNGFRGKFIY